MKAAFHLPCLALGMSCMPRDAPMQSVHQCVVLSLHCFGESLQLELPHWVLGDVEGFLFRLWLPNNLIENCLP